MKEIELNSEYIAYIDYADEKEWNNLVLKFADANVNQTWAYNTLRSLKTSTVIVRQNGHVVAIAILRLVTFLNSKVGVAYVGSGPLWKLNDKPENTDFLGYMLQALREEYVVNRKLFLRISPNIYTNDLQYSDLFARFKTTKGFYLDQTLEQTLFLDLTPSVDELRKGLHQKWRNLLNKGEKNEFKVSIGTDKELFDKFKIVYAEMLSRKKYPGAIDIHKVEQIQSALSDDLKYTIVICEQGELPMAGAVFSTIGDTGIYFLGATADAGTKNSSSYVVQWEMIKWMKEKGLKEYDLGGCTPDKKPETYHFKAGICGKTHVVHKRIGILEASNNPLSVMFFGVVKCVVKLRKVL